MLLKTLVIASLRVEGVHAWLSCPLQEVAYLKNFHRHEFHIKVKKLVVHNDRDVEIIMLKNQIRQYLISKYPLWEEGASALNFFGRSCEMLAEDILKQFDLLACEVLEDGENGAEVINLKP